MGGNVMLRNITYDQVNSINEAMNAYKSEKVLTIGTTIFHVDAYIPMDKESLNNTIFEVNYGIETNQAVFYLGMLEDAGFAPEVVSRDKVPPHFYITCPMNFLKKKCMDAGYTESNEKLKPLTPKLNVLKAIIASSEHRKKIGLTDVQCLNDYNLRIDGVKGFTKTTYAEKLAKLRALNTTDITFEVYSINYGYCNLISDAEGTLSNDLKVFYDQLLVDGTEIKRVKTDPKESLPSLYVMNWQE